MSRNCRAYFLFCIFTSLTQIAFSKTDPMTINILERVGNRLEHRLNPYSQTDEAFDAKAIGLLSESDKLKLLEGASDNYFNKMDYGITLPENQKALQKKLDAYIPGISQSEAVRRTERGRNNWIVWTGGNDRFWDYMTRATLGHLDFLKILSNHPSLPFSRSDRWEKLGVVNEPCFNKISSPQTDRWGLWLDQRDASCVADPFADEKKYPGIKIGSRGQTLKYNGKSVKHDVGSFYGLPTGVIGLRLFPNPDFDQAAADKWDSEKFYNDPAYYNDPKLVRPYRVGMSCAFCHVGPNPSRPPSDFNNPHWENLTSNAGAQYFWVDRLFVWDYKKNEDSFVYQLLHTSRPGTLDTSLISSDQINNPRTMNGVYDLPARVALAIKMNHREMLADNEKLNSQFSFYPSKSVPDQSPLRSLYNSKSSSILSPRVLKDGSDSVGALGALNRVYVNIGLFSENWIQNFLPLMGGVGDSLISPFYITPFRIDVANKNSLYWQATVNQTPDLALFFLVASQKDSLANAPNGTQYLKDMNSDEIKLGQKVFAQNCASCHSSKLPEKVYSIFNKNSEKKLDCVGANYSKCWKEFVEYVRTDEFKVEMEKLVMQPDFLKDNFLSNELRIPANVIDSQLCSPIAKNAIKGNIWDNFSSSTYKNLPSVGEFTVNFPYLNKKESEAQIALKSEKIKEVPDGGRGYLRPASLISVWATAPFLQNNTVGLFDPRGTVEGRMKSYTDSIDKLLNPEKRALNKRVGEIEVYYRTSFGDVLPGLVDVTTTDSYLKIPRGYLPPVLYNMIKGAQKLYSSKNKKANAELFVKIDSLYNERQALQSTAKAVQHGLSGDKSVKRQSASAENYIQNDDDDMLELGPIPAGVPVNLISNIDLMAPTYKLVPALNNVILAILHIKNNREKLTGYAARDYFMQKASESLLSVSQCKDFVVNRGHYFGTKYSPENKAKNSQGLNVTEKAALIEYMKHF